MHGSTHALMLHCSAVCLRQELETVPISQLVHICRLHGNSQFPWLQMCL